MAKQKRIITAGRLVSGVVYTVSALRDSPLERGKKNEISSAAREKINLRTSWQKLEVLLAANFGFRDLHVVLTYDDAHLPDCRAAAVKRVRKWITQLRAARKLRGDRLKYVYVTEQLSAEGGRLHHHVVLNGTGRDYEELRSLWDGGTEVDIEPLSVWTGYEDLARYLTKEPREVGKAVVGARTWAASVGLSKPEVETGAVPDNMTLTPPVGAIVLAREGPIQNGFGAYLYLKYLLPEKKEEREEKKCRPPRRRKKE